MVRSSGRPPKAIKQEKFLGFFVTNRQYDIIRGKVSGAGVNMSDYLRQVAIHGKVKARWSGEEREMFKRLVGMSNDIHRLLQIAREKGVLEALHYFEGYRMLMDDIIKRFGNDQ